MDADSVAAGIERDIAELERLKTRQLVSTAAFTVKATTRAASYSFASGETVKKLSIYFTADNQPNPFAQLQPSTGRTEIQTRRSIDGSKQVLFRVFLYNNDGVARTQNITWQVKSNDTGEITW